MNEQLLLTSLLVCLSLMLGGGGVAHPARELLLELVSAGIFAIAVWRGAGEPRRSLPLSFRLFLLLMLALPALQLVPLPESIWHALPGRDLERQALALVGADHGWRPLSLAPDRTLASLLGMVPPVLAMIMVARLDVEELRWVLLCVVGVSLLGLLLGAAVTRAGVGAIPLVFNDSTPILLGFQANKNHEADVLLIGMMAYALVVREWTESRALRLSRRYYIGLLLGGCMVFATGVLLTHSRMGVALLPLAVISVAYSSVPYGRRRTLFVAGAGVALLGAAAAGLVFSGNRNATNLVVGYMLNHESRPEIWTDSWFVAKQYLPFGSGMGTFVTVFPGAERLEVVDPQFTNRAHNDYVEMLIEGGIPAVIIFAILCSMLMRWLWLRLKSSSPAARRHGAFALATLAVLALHSLVDYPFRTIAVASLAALAAAMLMPAIPAPKVGVKVRKTR